MCICSTCKFLWICSPEFLINPWPFIVSFLWNSLFVFEFSESFSVLYIVFLFLFDWKEHHMLFSSSVCWIHLVYDPPMSIFVANSGIISWFQCCLFMANSAVYLCTTLSLSINLSEDISSFCVLAIVSSATVNVGVHVSFWMMDFGGYKPRCGCQILCLALLNAYILACGGCLF